MRRVPRLGSNIPVIGITGSVGKTFGEGNDISGAVAALVSAENGQKPQ